MINKRVAIGGRPVSDPDAESWVRRGDGTSQATDTVRAELRTAPHTELRTDSRTDPYTARLTIDVTPELRGRIKVAAFRQGRTVADLLRTLFEREFPRLGSNP